MADDGEFPYELLHITNLKLNLLFHYFYDWINFAEEKFNLNFSTFKRHELTLIISLNRQLITDVSTSAYNKS